MATIFVYNVKNIDSGLNSFLFIIFLPATIFPELILFTEREPWNMILICQLITLLILWPFFWLIIHLCRDDNNQ
jgi:predicted permease